MAIPNDNLESQEIQEISPDQTDLQPTVHSVRTDELSEEELDGVAGGQWCVIHTRRVCIIHGD